jgi:hypothetical protein
MQAMRFSTRSIRMSMERRLIMSTVLVVAPLLRHVELGAALLKIA